MRSASIGRWRSTRSPSIPHRSTSRLSTQREWVPALSIAEQAFGAATAVCPGRFVYRSVSMSFAARAKSTSASVSGSAVSSPRIRACTRRAERHGVRDFVVEHHHRVARDEAVRETPLELERQLLAQQKFRVAHRVAHLEVVLDRHLGDRVGVGLRSASNRERCDQSPRSSRAAGRARRSLRSGVHALAVERHDRVRGVAEQQQSPRTLPAARHARCPCGRPGARRTRARAPASAARRRRNARRKNASTASRRRRALRSSVAVCGRNSVAVKLPSVFGSAISMKPPRGQMCSAWLDRVSRRRARRQRELLVAVLEQLLGRVASELARAARGAPPSPRRRPRSAAESSIVSRARWTLRRASPSSCVRRMSSAARSSETMSTPWRAARIDQSSALSPARDTE